jgi:hypothetical protein
MDPSVMHVLRSCDNRRCDPRRVKRLRRTRTQMASLMRRTTVLVLGTALLATSKYSQGPLRADSVEKVSGGLVRWTRVGFEWNEIPDKCSSCVNICWVRRSWALVEQLISATGRLRLLRRLFQRYPPNAVIGRRLHAWMELKRREPPAALVDRCPAKCVAPPTRSRVQTQSTPAIAQQRGRGTALKGQPRCRAWSDARQDWR